MHLHKLHSRYATNFGAVQNKRRKTSTIWFLPQEKTSKQKKGRFCKEVLTSKKIKCTIWSVITVTDEMLNAAFSTWTSTNWKRLKEKRIFCIYAQIKADLVKYELNGIWNPIQPKHIYCFVEYCRNIMAGWISFFPSQVSGGGSFHVLLNPIQNQNFLSRFELIFIFCIPLLLSLAHCGNMLRPPAALLKTSSALFGMVYLVLRAVYFAVSVNCIISLLLKVHFPFLAVFLRYFYVYFLSIKNVLFLFIRIVRFWNNISLDF